MYEKAKQIACFLSDIDPNGEYTADEVMHDPLSYMYLMQGMLEDLGSVPDPKHAGLNKMIDFCLDIFCATNNH